MHFKKKIASNLNKCYSIAPLHYNGKQHFLVAAEKKDPCLLFDIEGNLEKTIWDSPGGTMSMVQVPNTNGQFLATWKFYSPNDSADAAIVLAQPLGSGQWKVRTICKLPFVHRFDILRAGNTYYLLACTLKSGHLQKDDWSMPGKVYFAELPEDLSVFSETNPLPLTILKEDLHKNHGFFHFHKNGCESALVTCEEGIFKFTPPSSPSLEWKIEHMLSLPTSDAALIDLDGDGIEELVAFSPFHGANIHVYKQTNEKWNLIYSHEPNTEFLHAIWCGNINGTNAAVIGHRGGDRDLLLLSYDSNSHQYVTQIIDHDCGPANVTWISNEEHGFLVSTNREINEIAIYEIDNT